MNNIIKCFYLYGYQDTEFNFYLQEVGFGPKDRQKHWNLRNKIMKDRLTKLIRRTPSKSYIKYAEHRIFERALESGEYVWLKTSKKLIRSFKYFGIRHLDEVFNKPFGRHKMLESDMAESEFLIANGTIIISHDWNLR